MNEHVALKPSTAGDSYGADFYEWSLRQADLVRRGRFELLDTENIAEEIENLARSELHSVESHFQTLIEHLLKLRFFSLSADPRPGWRVTVAKTRSRLDAIFESSPSLSARREAIFLAQCSKGARFAALALHDDLDAVRSIGLFAVTPAFSIEEALDPDFFPGD